MKLNAKINILDDTNNIQVTDELIESLLDSYPKENSNYLEEHIIREHIYFNEDGNPYMRMVKLDGDSNFISQKFEDGKFKTGTKGLKYIPYKLPELIVSVRNNKTIFITNGEKDAETLIELGFSATTAPFTISTKWNSTCNQYIKGANVVVIKETSEEAQEFALKTLQKVKKVTKNATTLLLEKVCNSLNIECNTKMDITKLRTALNDDEKLISLFKSVSDKMQRRC